MKTMTGRDTDFQIEEKIKRYSQVSHYVLITGERGTGKTTIAKRLHRESPRSKKQFVNLNCATLSENLLESELFGYEKGAFTGAAAPRAGLFEIASGGTLFLDEIGEIPLKLQAKLLKAVEEKTIRRVGSNLERKIDARIVTATSQNLQEEVVRGNFRPDLFDRLNILNLQTIPLRCQKKNIRRLFLARLNVERSAVGRKNDFEVNENAFRILESYTWHGNFRELINFAIRVAVEFSQEEIIGEREVGRLLREQTPTGIQSVESGKRKDDFSCDSDHLSHEQLMVSLDTKRDDLKSVYLKAAGSFIEHHLKETGGNFRETARVIGTTHSTVSRILKKYRKSELSAK